MLSFGSREEYEMYMCVYMRISVKSIYDWCKVKTYLLSNDRTRQRNERINAFHQPLGRECVAVVLIDQHFQLRIDFQ